MHYSLSQVSKMVVSAIFAVGAAVALFITYDPNLVQAVAALVGPVTGVILVFGAKNHSPDDLQKALEQLKAAVIGVVGFFITVPASTEAKITALIAAAVSFLAVYWVGNRDHA